MQRCRMDLRRDHVSAAVSVSRQTAPTILHRYYAILPPALQVLILYRIVCGIGEPDPVLPPPNLKCIRVFHGFQRRISLRPLKAAGLFDFIVQEVCYGPYHLHFRRGGALCQL